MAAPLLDSAGSLGMIVLSSRLHVRRFSEQDLELLAALGSVAALRIRNLSLAEESARRRTLEKEMALAREIQLALLPEHLPQIPGYSVFAANDASRAVSGDFYEFQGRDEGDEQVIVIADGRARDRRLASPPPSTPSSWARSRWATRPTSSARRSRGASS
jgi:sigma-B regulation protein RsbU (phosphoserine phosphatase)